MLPNNLIPILFLLWLVLILFSCCGVVSALIRRGPRHFASSLLCPVGAVLCGAFLSAAIGLAERTWTLSHAGLWIALSIGLIGILLSAIGWREVFRRPRLPGECTQCGYAITGLDVCPECGMQSRAACFANDIAKESREPRPAVARGTPAQSNRSVIRFLPTAPVQRQRSLRRLDDVHNLPDLSKRL